MPVVVFPLAGVLTTDKAAAAYGDPLILLFMGGFMLSKAAEHWGAHRRIAQVALACHRWHERSPHRVGSIGCHNVHQHVDQQHGNSTHDATGRASLMDRDKTGKLAVPLLLSVAYGSEYRRNRHADRHGANGVFMGVYQKATGLTVPFHQWMMLCVPITIVMMFAAWLLLTYKLSGVDDLEMPPDEQWTTPQKRTLAIFGLACLAWITREIPFGGWSTWFGVPEADDMTVAIAATLLLFIIPSGNGEKGSRLAQLEDCGRYSMGRLDSIRRRHLPRHGV